MVTNQDIEMVEDEDQMMYLGNAASAPSSPRERGDENVVEEILEIIESAKAIGDYRKTQKKECHNLVRRMKLLPLLEEIKDVDRATIPEAAIACLKKLRRAFRSARKFLKLCHAGSKIYLTLETEAMMVRLHGVYEKISQALEGMPYEELGIPEEEKNSPIENLPIRLDIGLFLCGGIINSLAFCESI
ncbi:UNVERIFIED_CONTAM: hypothetical protein Sradi_3538300 [Sesamum radiatum]|uniref:RING-type E3 ubiquitin transferase n=1 Tax=Sesamum radiatum TaxID=300843 RepID=A0AAW2QG45_SESRA